MGHPDWRICILPLKASRAKAVPDGGDAGVEVLRGDVGHISYQERERLAGSAHKENSSNLGRGLSVYRSETQFFQGCGAETICFGSSSSSDFKRFGSDSEAGSYSL